MSQSDALPKRKLYTATAHEHDRLLSASSLLIPLAVGLVLLALFVVFPLQSRIVTLNIGDEGPLRAPDETATARWFGFHEPERDSVSYRWTKQWSRVVFPNAHRLGEPLLVRVRLCGCRPEGQQPTVDVAINRQPPATLETSGAYREYTLVAPQQGAINSDLFLELRSSTAAFGADTRQVGARLDRVELVAAPTPSLPWPQPLILALVGAGAALVVTQLTRKGVRPALLGGLLIGPAIALFAYRPQELAPATPVLASLIGIAMVAVARPTHLAHAITLLALVILLPLTPQLLGGWMVDDAFISFRYAENLVAGHGLVFNPGERVEGYTNFLWTMLAAAIIRLGGDPVYVTQVVTLLIGQATVALCYGAGRALAQGSGVGGQRSELFTQPALIEKKRRLWIPLVAPLLLATSGPFLLYAPRGGGMETALFALLLLAGVYAVITGRVTLAGAILALAAMTRPEGVMVFALTVMWLAGGWGLGARSWGARDRERGRLGAGETGSGRDRETEVSRSSFVLRPSSFVLRPSSFVLRRSSIGRFLLAFLALFLPYYIWRYSYYGLPLPNTFYVKVGATDDQVWRGVRYLAAYWSAEGAAWLVGALVLVGVWGLGLGRQGDGETRRRGDKETGRQGDGEIRRRGVGSIFALLISNPVAYVAMLVVVYSAYIAAVGGDWLPEARFVVPIIPLLALLAQAGLGWIAAWGRWGALLAGALLAWALFDHTRYALTTSAYDSRNRIWSENTVVARRREVGRWLNEQTPPDTLIAVEAAGALPYYSRRPTIDILGLNDRHIAGLDVATMGQGKPGHEKTDIPYVLSRRPQIIPYFSIPYFSDQPEFRRNYILEEHEGPEGHTVIVYRRME
jgi:hypothetical protein